MSSRKSPRSPGKGSPRTPRRRSSSARRSAERRRRRTSSQKRSDDRWLEQSFARQHGRQWLGDEMPEAEAEVFSMASIPARTPAGKLAVFRPKKGATLREIGGEDLLDFDDAAVAELLMPGSPRVLAVAKKNRSMGTRISRSLGKMVGLIPRNKMSTRKGLDVDMDKFEGSCLDGLALTDKEIGLIKFLFRNEEKGHPDLRRFITQYCETREMLLSKDPEFEHKYPKMYYNILNLAHWDGYEDLVAQSMAAISTMTPARIRQAEDASLTVFNLDQHTMLLNRLLYDGDLDDHGYARLSKPDGRGHGKKSRKSRKSNRRKSNKRK
jgi:hypothetical protein